MNIQSLHPADQLVMFMQRIYDKGLTTTSGGNLSILDSDGTIWITPASVDKGALTRKDIICVHPDGTTEGPHRPSSELPFHASIYKIRPDLRAVLHAHPPALMAFSITNRIPNLDLIPSIRHICKDAQIAEYGVPGSEDLSNKIRAVFADGCDIAVLKNHGVCIGATDMFTAFQRFETLNFAANLEIQAAKIGKRKCLSEEDLSIAATNYCPKLDEFLPQAVTDEELCARRDMIALIRRSYRQGLFTAAHGTYSVRLADGSFLITPFGQDRVYLQEDDLVRIMDGMKEPGKTPSRAVHLHEVIYKNHPDVRAILQALPLHAMAFAITDADFDPRIIPESYILLRDIKKIPYAQLYAGQDVAARAFDAAHSALMVENNCVIVTGNSPLQAFDRLEVLESTAISLINASSLGEIHRICDEEVENLKKRFQLEV